MAEGLQALNKKHEDLLQSQDEQISSLKNDLRKVLEILNQKLDDDANFNEGLEVLEQKIENMKTTQNEQITSVHESLKEGLETLDTNMKATHDELTAKVDESLNALDKKVDSLERKQFDQVSNLLNIVSNGLLTIDSKFQQTYDVLYANLSSEFQKSLNDSMMTFKDSCHKV